MPRRRGTRIRSDHAPKPNLFGWCMDGVHERCITSFDSRLTDHTYTCSCTCHTGAEKPNENGENLASLGVSGTKLNP